MDRPHERRGRSLLLAAQHQLRQPLNALSLLIGELRRGPQGPELAAVADDMRYALELSNRWLEILVELERAEQGLLEASPRAVPLQAAFQRAREEFEPRCAQHGLVLRVVPSHATVRADPDLLHRVLGLLLDNAVKFTPAGKLLLGCRRARGGVRVEIWDSGPGLTGEQAVSIFEPFFRLENEVRPRERGLGIGLALARRLAEISGDSLTVAARPGRGCCFALTLQPAERPAGLKRPFSGGANAIGNVLAGADVVLLEGKDSAALRGYLQSWGAAVRVVSPLALGAALSQPPRLLMADHEAFGVAGGWQLLRPGGTQVVLVSDRLPEGSGEPQAGVHVLQRPVRPARLRALCHFALMRTGEGAEP